MPAVADAVGQTIRWRASSRSCGHPVERGEQDFGGVVETVLDQKQHDANGRQSAPEPGQVDDRSNDNHDRQRQYVERSCKQHRRDRHRSPFPARRESFVHGIRSSVSVDVSSHASPNQTVRDEGPGAGHALQRCDIGSHRWDDTIIAMTPTSLPQIIRNPTRRTHVLDRRPARPNTLRALRDHTRTCARTRRLAKLPR